MAEQKDDSVQQIMQMKQERDKSRMEGYQAMIKAQKEGFGSLMESVQKSHETRDVMTNARMQSICETGKSQEQSPEAKQEEKLTLSREAQQNQK
ncbi:MAG: hypothetical protein AB2L14_17285 [Candidatus Xenobiia bacterium LiM19]